MNVTAAVKTRVESKLRKCHAMAEAHYGRTFTFPRITYTVRGTTGGKAWGDDHVSFNPILLMEQTDKFIARTVPHELAHCIDYIVNSQNHRRIYKGQKRKVHGADWKRVMGVLGAADATRCHSYDTTRAAVRKGVKHEWACNDCSGKMELGVKRHNKMLAAAPNKGYRPSGRRCTWAHTYRYVGVVGATQVAAAPKVPEPAKAATAPTGQFHNKKLTKKDRAETLYLTVKGRARLDIIALFVSQLSMTAAGAATYYANCKKAFG